MIAIQADEHIPREIITGLNARGIEAYSAYQEGLSGTSDRDVFEYVQRKGRIFLTNGTGFFSLPEDRKHHGIFYLTTQRASIGHIIRDIARLIDTSQLEEFESRIFYIPHNP